MSLINDMLQDLEARDVKTPVPSVPEKYSTSPSRRFVAVGSIAGVLAAGFLFYHLTTNSDPGADALSNKAGVGHSRPDHGTPGASTGDTTDTATVSQAGAEPLRAGLTPAEEHSTNEVEGTPPRDAQTPKPAPPTSHSPSLAVSAPPDRAEPDMPGSSRTGYGTRKPVEPPVENTGPELRQTRDNARTTSAAQDPASDQAVSRETRARDAAADSVPVDVPRTSRIVVQPAGGGLDDDQLDPARRALSRGQAGVAISRLEDLLRQQPGLTEARILLARTLVASQRPQRAAQVLSEGLARNPDNHDLAFWLARNQFDQGRVETALETLQSHSPPVAEAPDYYLLLGAVLRRLERHESAFLVYQRITGSSPGNARAWLGLALSAEALDRVADARRAYENTLESGDARTVLFARQRLNVLGPDKSPN